MPDWLSTLTTLPLIVLLPSAGNGPLVLVAASVQPVDAEAEDVDEVDEDDDELVVAADAVAVIDVPELPLPPPHEVTKADPAPAEQAAQILAEARRFRVIFGWLVIVGHGCILCKKGGSAKKSGAAGLGLADGGSREEIPGIRPGRIGRGKPGPAIGGR